MGCKNWWRKMSKYHFPGNELEWIVNWKNWWFIYNIYYEKERFLKKTRISMYVQEMCFDIQKKADKCFYESNIYWNGWKINNIKEVLQELNDHDDLDFVTIQGETYGAGVQNRTYSIEGHDFMAFNLIFFGYKNGEVERFNPITMTKILRIMIFLVFLLFTNVMYYQQLVKSY